MIASAVFSTSILWIRVETDANTLAGMEPSHWKVSRAWQAWLIRMPPPSPSHVPRHAPLS